MTAQPSDKSLSITRRTGARKSIQGLSYSVIMAVYQYDRPVWLQKAIDSMLGQTVKPDEVIVVVDGPVPTQLEAVLRSYGGAIHTVQLSENKGLWNALNKGLSIARNELIARMDADDISVVDRAEKQLCEFEKDEELALLSGTVAEFDSSPEEIISYRKLPITHADILKFARYRSPFNHPAVMFKKSAVLEAGGYSALMRSEDYDLWIRMLMNGCQARNLSDTILYYRVGESNHSRKGSLLQQRELMNLHTRYFRAGFLSMPQYLRACMIRIGFAVMPAWLKQQLYRGVLRKRA